MDMETIGLQRDEVRRFLVGKERVCRFPVACPLSERIEYIYRVIFPGLDRYRFYARFFWGRVAQYIDYSPIKVLLYRMIGIRIGKGVFIAADVLIDVHFPALIEIEDYAILGWGARLFSHEYGDGHYRIGRILVGEGALVGAFAAIQGGVTVGAGAEIPYSLLVHRDVPPGCRPKPHRIFREKDFHG